MEFDLLKIVILTIIPLILLFSAFILNNMNKANWFIRKYMHTAGLTLAAIYGAYIETLDEILIIVAIIVVILVIMQSIPSIRIVTIFLAMGTREGESQLESLINTTLTISTTLILLALLQDLRWVFMASILSVALGDGLGEFIGKPYGKHKYKIFAQKSIEGSLGVIFGIFVGIIISMILFSTFSLSTVGYVILISIAVAFVESISVSFIDNIAMPGITAYLLILLIV